MDESVGELRLMIAERAAGNPFFAEEMVRELVQRGALAGEHGRYVCRVDVAEVAVPATVEEPAPAAAVRVVGWARSRRWDRSGSCRPDLSDSRTTGRGFAVLGVEALPKARALPWWTARQMKLADRFQPSVQWEQPAGRRRP